MPSKDEEEEVGRMLVDGFLRFGLPAIVVGIAGTYIMRRRANMYKTTRVENFLLAGLHYYAAMELGAGIGMAMYEPFLEDRIVKEMPNSHTARVITESRNRKH